jgi:hypothetical protein
MGIINKIQKEVADENGFDVKVFIDQICNYQFGSLFNAVRWNLKLKNFYLKCWIFKTMPLLSQIQKLEASTDSNHILNVKKYTIFQI